MSDYDSTREALVEALHYYVDIIEREWGAGKLSPNDPELLANVALIDAFEAAVRKDERDQVWLM
jgi:hypothetical protein